MFHLYFSTTFAAFHPRQRPHCPPVHPNCHQANFVPFGESLMMAAVKLLALASRQLVDLRPAFQGRAADSDDLKIISIQTTLRWSQDLVNLFKFFVNHHTEFQYYHLIFPFFHTDLRIYNIRRNLLQFINDSSIIF